MYASGTFLRKRNAQAKTQANQDEARPIPFAWLSFRGVDPMFPFCCFLSSWFRIAKVDTCWNVEGLSHRILSDAPENAHGLVLFLLSLEPNGIAKDVVHPTRTNRVDGCQGRSPWRYSFERECATPPAKSCLFKVPTSVFSSESDSQHVSDEETIHASLASVVLPFPKCSRSCLHLPTRSNGLFADANRRRERILV